MKAAIAGKSGRREHDRLARVISGSSVSGVGSRFCLGTMAWRLLASAGVARQAHLAPASAEACTWAARGVQPKRHEESSTSGVWGCGASREPTARPTCGSANATRLSVAQRANHTLLPRNGLVQVAVIGPTRAKRQGIVNPRLGRTLGQANALFRWSRIAAGQPRVPESGSRSRAE